MTTPSKVVFLRKLPLHITENELADLGRAFGNVTNVLRIPSKDQGFIEFSDISEAENMVSNHLNQQITYSQRTIAVDFSQHATIQKKSNVTALTASPNTAPATPTPVLLVNIQHSTRTIDADMIHQIFGQYGGTVCRIILFERNGNTNALVEYQNSSEAALAKSVLDGQVLFSDGGVLKISHSNMHKLSISQETRIARDYTKTNVHSNGFSTGGAPITLGRQPPQPSVLHLSNLDEEKVACNALFKLFGVYGDVLRAKILYKNRTQALLQFRDAEQSLTAMRFLNGVSLYGKPMSVHPSRNADIIIGSNDPLTKDYTTSHLHRYRVPGSKNFNHISAPSQALHVSNLPEGVTKEQLVSAFSQYGKVESFEFFHNTSKMGLLVMNSLDSAINVLINLHGENIIENPSNNKGIVISFSSRRIA